MADLPTVDSQGKGKSTLAASDAVFAAPIKAHVVRLAVNALLANRRAGTSATRNRSLVRGGGRKPFRQKGTGRARQGTSRAPNMRGGATAFGPMPRSWRQGLNRKVRRQALTSVLSSMAQDGAIRVIEDFGIKEPKTREMAALLARLNLDGGKTLILLSEPNEAVALSARNIPWATVASTEELNVYDLVIHDSVVATPGAIRRIEQLLGAMEEDDKQ